MIRKILCLTALLLAAPADGAGPARATRQAACEREGVDADISRTASSRHGEVSLWTAPDGTQWSRMSFNLRGFVTEIDEQNRFAPDGTLASMVVRGKNPQGDAAETYDVEGRHLHLQKPGRSRHRQGRAQPRLCGLRRHIRFLHLPYRRDAEIAEPSASTFFPPAMASSRR